MIRLLPAFLGFLLLVGQGSPAVAASPKAAALRQAHGLSAFTPTEKFLAGNFVADEMNPGFIFGPVKAFAAARQYPTAWLMEEAEKNRLAGQASTDTPVEYTIYLEEDRPDKVVYYVFVDQSRLTPQQWLEWRRQFHKSKTDSQFGGTKSKLEQACNDGCGVSGELRYIQENGELLAKSPEEALRHELRFAPIYDLSQQKKISK
jgi:hypothetical protein